MRKQLTRLAILRSAIALAAAPAAAQQAEVIVVTAMRESRPAIEVPASIDAVPGTALREDQLRANLSEAMGSVPGLVVANRQNYAQDLQVSTRGFGARASFGTRGIRIIADGIPATMPDGQGQAASIDLDSAKRIEVMRGPYSALYGNASGGVIQVFTADGAGPPTVDFFAAGGTYGTRRESLVVQGDHEGFSYRAGGAHFTTDGYREHSAATRDTGNAKLGFGLGPGRMDVVFGSLRQDDTQDPLGLTRAQYEADPRQADTAATLFDTRKSIRQNQAGAVYEMDLAGGSKLTGRVYYGTRDITQYLGMRGDTGLSAGGVVDLDRGYGGAAVRWSKRLTALGGPLAISAGLEYDRQDETRKGFVNDFGRQGALRRDEDDAVNNSDAYVQAEWTPAPAWSISGGLRYSHVHFDSTDHFVTGANPDDSGEITYMRTLPTAGVIYRWSENVRIYANAGQGFETPTFAELAYRAGGATGLNLGLQPSRSNQFEVGTKVKLPGGGALNAAAFRIDTRDEIVVNANVNGRTDYKNASRTERTGFEISARETFGKLELSAAATWLDAHFRDSFKSGTPPQTVASGNKLPGVPRATFQAQGTWRPGWLGMHLTADARYVSSIHVDDLNSDSAPAATVVGVRAGWEQSFGGLKVSEFVRVDNATDRKYSGSVIVAESRGRFFEPAPGRNYLVGVNLSYSF